MTERTKDRLFVLLVALVVLLGFAILFWPLLSGFAPYPFNGLGIAVLVSAILILLAKVGS